MNKSLCLLKAKLTLIFSDVGSDPKALELGLASAKFLSVAITFSSPGFQGTYENVTVPQLVKQQLCRQVNPTQ